ncbi:nucleotide sugar dehydrogenase [Robertkochia solimangrovi]|uniref:nucleotide sugar dehydrogenase n=1 Tax=Robertkochia solimangrovi TaxID=2213046 RepID=UPI00117C66F0|nr:nucleotide sugar dehydrogenase [Robertkochia solimangrovi]TRZ44962.1 nucleotide sugar dehydrogenase [Robertkochia solimangrovi]
MPDKIAVIGLGYVGLPLARLFATKYPVIGFDINESRVSEINNGKDHTLEVEEDLLKEVLLKKVPDSDIHGLFCSSDLSDLKSCNIFIVTVPTPVDKNNQPVLTPLVKSSETVGSVLKQGDIVIYESTVNPGVTEDVCVPVLERVSGLKFNQDFFAGYSPERINPGDKERTIEKILKITSGSTPEIADKVDALYASIIKAGTHKAPSIKVAEAAKVIENSQRDINIAFMNELSKIFNLLGIKTKDVLEAAGTKWNFLRFTPGLVGGHCIGVDPYYLAQKAQEVGYYPEIILTGRRLNDGMGSYVAKEVIRHMVLRDIRVKEAEILVLGMTFKENCPDVRNTRVIDVIQNLSDYQPNITVWDTWANPREVKEEYGIEIVTSLPEKKYDAIVLTVAHKEFMDLNLEVLKKENCLVYDVKGVLGEKADAGL